MMVAVGRRASVKIVHTIGELRESSMSRFREAQERGQHRKRLLGIVLGAVLALMFMTVIVLAGH